MKKNSFLFVIIFVFNFSASASQEEKICSNENLQYLLSMSAKVSGIVGHENAKVVQLFSDPDYSKSNLEQLRKKFIDIQKESAAKVAKMGEQIVELVHQHPECDKEHNFTVK